MYQCQDETGDVPNYGNNDGALIFPVASSGYRDFRPVLNTVIALTEGKKVYKPGNYDEELLWFGSKSNLLKANIKRIASAFNDSGFFTFRHNDGFLMICLQNFKTRPAHMDQLHVDLWHKGLNILCDSGTYSYASDFGRELSTTAGHNTIKISKTEQMNKRGPFLITDWSRRGEIKHDSKSFVGSMISQNGYKHTRSIFKTDSGYRMLDEVEGNGDTCEFYFHTPCEVRLTADGFNLYNEGNIICSIETTGIINVVKAHRSLYYLKKDEINCVLVRGSMNNKECSMNFEIKLVN